MKTLITVLSLLLCSSQLHAAEKLPACQPKLWEQSRSMDKNEVIRVAKKMPREELIRTMAGELAKPKHALSVDPVLLKTLYATEKDPGLTGYYTSLAYMTYGTVIDDITKGWPKIRLPRKEQLTAHRICELYKAAVKK